MSALSTFDLLGVHGDDRSPRKTGTWMTLFLAILHNLWVPTSLGCGWLPIDQCSFTCSHPHPISSHSTSPEKLSSCPHMLTHRMDQPNTSFNSISANFPSLGNYIALGPSCQANMDPSDHAHVCLLHPLISLASTSSCHPFVRAYVAVDNLHWISTLMLYAFILFLFLATPHCRSYSG